MDKIETSMMEIAQSKIFADEEKYFSLFEKHIPDLGSDKKVLIYAIDNLGCICKMIEKNPNAQYTIYGNACVNDCIKNFYPKAETIDSNPGNLKEYNIDMKFDCILMNPPYEKNLHLKILAEAIKHLKDDDSKVVNLSPVRWLQDPFAKYKKNSDYNKFSNLIRKYLVNVNIITKLEAQQCFMDTVMGADLGIYICNQFGGFNCESLINPIIIKVLQKQKTCIQFDMNVKDGYRVRFPLICCNGGSGTNRKPSMGSFGKMLWFKDGIRDNVPWYNWYMHNQHTKFIDTIPCSVKFDSEIEANNFCMQFQTLFCKVYTHWVKSDVHVTPEIVLWMGDSINPRTGLKGYESEWTDEDFYKFFNITDEEKKIIEDTMAKYTK